MLGKAAGRLLVRLRKISVGLHQQSQVNQLKTVFI